jgi:curved DNA-binding protein CbpA
MENTLNTLSDEELFERMRSKKSNKKFEDNDDTSNNNDNTDINNIKRTGYDYYKILGVTPTTELSDIKRKYRHKIAEYHPDKLKFLSDSKKKLKNEQFQLIRMAGEILTNPEKKKFYDLQMKTLKSKDLQNQKQSFEDFLKLQDSEMTDDKKKSAQLEFKKHTEKMNQIRGLDTSSIDVKYDRNTSNKLLQDLQAQRDMEAIEIAQRNVFEGRSFNPSEFNKMFEKDKKIKDKKLKKKQEKGELVKYDDTFTAFNDTGVGNFISVNDDYGELFGKEDFKSSTTFGRNKSGLSDDELSISSLSDIEFEDDYNNHSKKKISDNDIRKFEQLRSQETSRYDKMNLSEFKSVMEDQFGISKNFGTMIGNEIGQKPSQITSHMVNAYNKLIEYESDDD